MSDDDDQGEQPERSDEEEKRRQRDARDLELLRVIATGGRDSNACLNELFIAYRGMLLSIGRRAGLSVASAEDLSQDVLIRIWQRADSFRGESSVVTWIRMIATNRLIDIIRQRPRTPEDPTGGEFLATLASDAPDVEDVLDRLLWEECYRREWLRFYEDFPERGKAISCHVKDGGTMQDVAQLLGRTPGATREFLSQSRKKLKEYLERCTKFIEAA